MIEGMRKNDGFKELRYEFLLTMIRHALKDLSFHPS